MAEMDANLRVLSRLDLVSMLEHAMREPGFARTLRGPESDADSTVVKTYIVEAAIPDGATQTQANDFALSLFQTRKRQLSVDATLYESDDAELFTIQGHSGKRSLTAYLDVSNPRFWLLHSMSSSQALGPFVSAMFSAGTELDRAWMPSQLLEKLSSIGPLRGLGLAYDRRVLRDVDFDTPEAPIEVLRMQFWGSSARQVLGALRAQDSLPNATTLSKIRIRVDGDGGDRSNLQDVKYDGKITARGGSFSTHLGLVNHIVDVYSTAIRKVEARYPLRMVLNEGTPTLQGEPLNFLFAKPIKHLDLFCSGLFSAREPFRLWGVPVVRNSRFYTVEAIDLHVGSNMRFELTPEYMRVYLPTDACGNTIIRLYTNLQHHYDALIKAEDGDGRSVFEF
ncbi:hypothetical protein [Longimicrobium sp.]|uniref:hypothetical protein n=1 Tax=Longimicrobium sp. TaxID=2029185 RepID=UPI002C851FFC|nr:hypothetical protein [Longimicrobium sp.]HSU15651.1 hypothetical protein [Longimicrobium sp.]